MSDRIDHFAKTVAERTTRRSALMGLGALALGSLGILGMGQGTKAKNNNDNDNYDNDKSLLTEAHKLLHQKYPQYNEVGIGQYCIKIKPKKIISWKDG